MSNELANIAHEYKYSLEQLSLIRDTIMGRKGTFNELRLFLYQCRRHQLDPLSRQAYWIAGQFTVSIDGERLIAQRSGQYLGQTPPEWCGPDGIWRDVWLRDDPPAAARIGVLRTGFEKPLYAVAKYKSYAKDGPVWKKMPELMISKCAESLALRKAFPNELSGIYSPEEMGSVSLDPGDTPDGEEHNGSAAADQEMSEPLTDAEKVLFEKAEETAKQGQAALEGLYKTLKPPERALLREWRSKLIAMYPAELPQ